MSPTIIYLAIICTDLGGCQAEQIPGPCAAEIHALTDASGNEVAPIYEPEIPIEPEIPEEYPYLSPDYLYDASLIPSWPTHDGH